MSEAKEMSELIARNVTAPQKTQNRRISKSKVQASLSGYVDLKNM
jgi:hypothetical protein